MLRKGQEGAHDVRRLPKGEAWETREVPSPDRVREAGSMSPSRREGRTARRKRILWRAISGFPEAGRPSMMSLTMSFVAMEEGASGSSSLPSGPMFFLGFWPSCQRGGVKNGNRNPGLPARNGP